MRYWICVLFSFFTGCSERADPKQSESIAPLAEIEVPLSVDELCEMNAHVVALRLVPSVQHGPLCRAGPVPEFLAPRVGAYACSATGVGRAWARDLLAAYTAGLIRVDWKRARRCINTSRTLRKTPSAITLLETPAWINYQNQCAHLAEGTVTLDKSCQNPWECADDLICVSETPWIDHSRTCQKPIHATTRAGTVSTGGACMLASDCKDPCTTCHIEDGLASGVCGLLKSAGEICGSRSDCLDDLDCIHDVCTVVGLEAMACNPDDESSCALGLSCVEGTCRILPTQGPCLNGALCGTETFCDASKTCVPMRDLGEPCDEPGNASLCAMGGECNEGVCIPVCYDNYSCPAGEYCHRAEGSPTVCKTVVQEGCTADELCGLGAYCESTTHMCKPQVPVGAACTGDAMCSSNHCLRDELVPLDGRNRCGMPQGGCRDNDFLNIAFMFGGLRLLRRKKNGGAVR